MLCVGWTGRNKPLQAEEPQLATTQCAKKPAKCLFVFRKLRLPLLQTSVIPASTFWKRCGDPWTRCLQKRHHDQLGTQEPTVYRVIFVYT